MAGSERAGGLASHSKHAQQRAITREPQLARMEWALGCGGGRTSCLATELCQQPSLASTCCDCCIGWHCLSHVRQLHNTPARSHFPLVHFSSERCGPCSLTSSAVSRCSSHGCELRVPASCRCRCRPRHYLSHPSRCPHSSICFRLTLQMLAHCPDSYPPLPPLSAAHTWNSRYSSPAPYARHILPPSPPPPPTPHHTPPPRALVPNCLYLGCVAGFFH
jgi:hypothetical protein